MHGRWLMNDDEIHVADDNAGEGLIRYGTPEWDAMLEQLNARQFKLAATEPFSWLFRSENLKRAADHLFEIYHTASTRSIEQFVVEVKAGLSEGGRVLEGQELEDFRDSELVTIYLMLMGYAIENLLKGKLLQQNPHFFKPKDKMDGFNGHDLVLLANRIGFKLTKEDRASLKELTNYILWQGKYPIPLQYKKDRDRSRGIPFKGRDLQHKLDDLWHRLAKFLGEVQHDTC
jgi:hypothetical protein